ncbi:hypothetical protein IF188_08260 [Microbacterium sp. NEAU-LLC]|uniref:Uncharacterized protein n=1 Tax=Microbacterium helvum TaxID=2773713 RepID=A0ABR8NLZ7_9MICO|nr:hypothetical protein [Microbacterium helvum]MBD3941685.1 hypothetical protein [Microbacterium helvum]
MNAADAVWAAAGDLDLVPTDDLFADMPEPARSWMLAWARTPHEGCEHAQGQVLYAIAGARRALCASCAAENRIDLITSHCGRCGALTGAQADPGSLFAAFALAADEVPGGLLCFAAVCSRCLTNDTTTDEGTRP